MPAADTSHDRAIPIGIICDVSEPTPGRPRIEAGLAYTACVRKAGGLPILLAPIVDAIPDYLALCRGFVFTGGKDPRMEPFGKVTSPHANLMHPVRQEFDTAILKALRDEREIPTLGICLGMQMMALVSGGELDQHLPNSISTHADHAGNKLHAVNVRSVLTPGSGSVASSHHQAVASPGSLEVFATSTDGVIEGIADCGRRFFVGVQWHPERSGDGALGQGVFDKLVTACRAKF